MSEPRVSDAEVARIVARTPVEFECDATAFENLACDLRDARRDLAALREALQSLMPSDNSYNERVYQWNAIAAPILKATRARNRAAPLHTRSS